MNRILCLIFFLPTIGFAQDDWGAFTQGINAKTLAGKKFKLEAAVRVELIDTNSQAEIWCRVDRTNKQIGFFYNMMDKPIRSKDWKVYSIAGKIDKDADYFMFGGLYSRSGIFYFDNFKLSVETTKGKFEEVKIEDGDFETDSLNPNWNYFKKSNEFVISLSKTDSYSGKQCCRVDGSKFVKSNSFGENDSVGKYASVNGIKLYYEIYGEGEPLLLLHGNSQSIEAFKEQIPELSKYYKVILVDTRGQGKSSEDGKTYTYDLFAEDMNAFLNYIKLDSIKILGWSDGGNTGLIMAMKYPKKVKKLVVMGANIFINHSVVSRWVIFALHIESRRLRSDTTYSGRNNVRLINLLLTEPKHRFEDLKNIGCPVLVIAGEKDIIKRKHTKEIAANIANSSLFIAPKETHFFPWENPGLFNKTVLNYFKN